jgi:flagellar biosynthetic protein FliO
MDAVRPVLSVLVVLGMVLAAAWWLRRANGAARVGFFRMGGSTPTMRILERLPLTPQHTLVLVELSNERLVLGIHPAGVTIIRSEPAAPSRRVTGGELG